MNRKNKIYFRSETLMTAKYDLAQVEEVDETESQAGVSCRERSKRSNKNLSERRVGAAGSIHQTTKCETAHMSCS